METPKNSPLTYLRKRDRHDLPPGIFQIGMIGAITSNLLLYVMWPIDSLTDIAILASASLIFVGLLIAQILHRRTGAGSTVIVSTVCMMILSITCTFVAPGTGAPLLLAQVGLMAGLLPILDRRQFRVVALLSGITILIIAIIASANKYTPFPSLPDDIWVTTIGTATGIVMLFCMIAHCHSYMTRIVAELQGKNIDLQHARNNLEKQVQTRTQALQTQNENLREEINCRRQAEIVLSQRNQELDAFNLVTLGLINKDNPADLFNEIVLRTCDLLKTSGTSILLINPQEDALETRFSSGTHVCAIRRTFKIGEELAGQIWESGKALHVDNYQEWTGKIDVDGFAKLGSLTGVPLHSESQIIGVLLTWRESDSSRFTDDDLDLLNRLGQLASTVYDNTQLLQTQRNDAQTLALRMQARTQELATLLNVANKLPTTAGLDAMLAMVFDQLSSVVKIDSAAIFYRLAQRNKNMLHTLYYRGPEHDNIEGVQAWPFEHLFLEIATHRQPIIIADVRSNTPMAEKFRLITRDVLGDIPLSTHITSWMGVPMLLNGEIMGILTLDNSQPNYFTPQHAELAMGIAQQATLAIENTHLQEQALQNAVNKAAQTERSRLARELHDSVSQAVFSIGLHARAMEQLYLIDQHKAQIHLVHVLSLAEAALAEIRALIYELRPESLEHEGILAALNKQITALHTRHNLKINLDLCESEPDVPVSIKEAIYRVSLEAIHNVVKHAHATEIDVHLAQHGQIINLEVSDNGIGFDPSTVPIGHFGLMTMRERVDQLSGQILVQSQPGAGTRVSLTIPLESDWPNVVGAL